MLELLLVVLTATLVLVSIASLIIDIMKLLRAKPH